MGDQPCLRRLVVIGGHDQGRVRTNLGSVTDQGQGTYAGDFSAEAIQDFNMDYVLTTYRPHTGGTPENIYEEMVMVVPGYDSFMTSVSTSTSSACWPNMSCHIPSP